MRARADGGLAAHMGTVARHLLGEPNKLQSSATELRYGTLGSLAVNLKKGTWFSHEEGKGGGVLELIRRERGLANGAAIEWLSTELGIRLGEAPQQPGRSKRRIVTTYDYLDENGELLFQVVRYEPKGFSQRRPNGVGGWIGKLDGTRRVLYRLPELVAADPVEPVFITEGEKDADRLRSLDLVATTSPQGAGKWGKVDRAVLAGRYVVALSDNDQPGRDHVADIARDLTGKAASLKVLHLPGLPGKGDVSDWLDASGTADELRRLAAEAAEWKEAPAPEREPDILSDLLNRYFVVLHGGKTMIAYEEEDPVLRRRALQFLDQDSLKLMYANRFVETAAGAVSVAKAWLTSPERRTYERLVLLPNQEAPPGTYNLWRGFGVEPKAGSWKTIRGYLLNVICSGDKGHFAYLINWLAYCVQYPERQAEVAVVLRGLKGTGKGTLGKMLLRIFRHHGLHISNSRHLLGNFNAHLLNALYLFLDEAFWAGDKQGEGVLKAIITEPSLMIEPKGLKLFLARNRLKIVIAANADWVVPATADERRYFAPTVSDHRRGDRAYFKKLHAAIDGDELPALLHHLLARNLSRFEVRDPPHTKELGRQKLIGADSVGQFWFDCLSEGAIVGTAEADWPASVVTQVLHAAYLDHAKAHGDRHPKVDVQMVEELKKLWAGCGVKLTRPRNQPYTAPDGTVIERPNRYVLDSLESHRRAFLEAMNIDPADHEWPKVEDAP